MALLNLRARVIYMWQFLCNYLRIPLITRANEIDGLKFHLPDEIIAEILSRLQVKSLMRFKCVSKPWRSLISSTEFAALHSKKAADDRRVFLQRRRVMFNVHEVGYRGLYSIDLDQFLHNHEDNPYESFVRTTKLDFVREKSHSKKKDEPLFMTYIYFCNNLVLGRNKFGLYLVNPATREVKRVPDTPTWRTSPATVLPDHCCFRGLGFDDTANDYKIFQAKNYDDFSAVYSVYSLRTDSWRQIECSTSYYPQSHVGFFFNGALHWTARSAWSADAVSILVCFVLADERFHEIELPPIPNAYVCSPEVGAFRDCLSITLRGYEFATDEFWVMKEYMVSESWIRMRVFKPYTGLLSHIGFSTESYDVMVYKKSLITYDEYREEYDGRKLRIYGVRELGYIVGVYFEGLFPLTIGGDKALN